MIATRMSRRNKIIIAVLIALFLLGILLMLLLAPPAPPSAPQDRDIPEDLEPSRPTGNLGTSTQVPVSRPPLSQRVEPPAATTPEPEEPPPAANVQRLAVAFAERFGSFSNQGNFENIEDLKAFMSPSMSTWADTYLEESRASRGTGTVEYFGVTTRAISSTLDTFDEIGGDATVTVNTQRSERRGFASTSEVYYQSLVVTFVMYDGEWKVDSAYWQEE